MFGDAAAGPWLRALLLHPRARPLRFITSGAIAAAVQLGLLVAFERLGWGIMSNAAALAVATQVNFLLSARLTWGDRDHGSGLFQRWLLYQGSTGTMAVVNMAVFLVARTWLPAVEASALGILAGAVGNYLSADRMVFRRPGIAGQGA